MTKEKKILIGVLMSVAILVAVLLKKIGIQIFWPASLWLLLSIAVFIVIKIGFPDKKILRIIPLLFLLLTLTDYCKSRKTQKDDSKNQKKLASSTSQKPVIPQNPSEVTKTDWGRLVRFTGREPDGVELYKTTRKGELFKIALIGEPGIVDNVRGDVWPIWGADGFARGWRKYFLYESIGIKPNAIVMMFGKPGNAKMEHVCTFDKNETEIIVESPEDGLPLYLYYHEPVVEGSYYCFKNNKDHTTLQIEKL